MSLYALIGAVETGLVFSLVALGSYVTFRVLNFPDLTVEGSFPLGAAVAATLIAADVDPWAATAVAGLAGFLAGGITAFLSVRLKILHILAGILTAIALYSINLRIMGRPNMPILGEPTVYDWLAATHLPPYLAGSLMLLIVVAVAKFLLDLFLSTGFGLAMRAAGANPRMARANGVDVNHMMFLGISLANLLSALGGALFAQLLGAADASMGIGVVIVAFASVIGGMALIPSRAVMVATFACIFGSVLYRLAIQVALNAGFIGLTASDVNVVTAVLVALALVAPNSGFSLRTLLSGRRRP
jgi:putative ABC transport system permease protein